MVNVLPYTGVKYPKFENVNECVQYLHEHALFHLPQIEYVLEKVIEKFKDFSRPINILDIGSGPATVPLAFCRVLPRHKNAHKYKVKISTVDPKAEFNKMIDTFKCENTNKSIEIIDNLKCSVYDDKLMNKNYDWIIIANSLSAFGEKKKIVDRLIELIPNRLPHKENNKSLLTIIENKRTKKFFPLEEFFKDIENLSSRFDNLKIIKLSEINEYIECPWLMNCKFYKYLHENHYSPYIISKSLLLQLK